MSSRFVSYAHQTLSRRRIKKLAAQYEGENMAVLVGANEDNFPFLVREPGVHSDYPEAFVMMMWNTSAGVLDVTDEDPVRSYATIKFLLDHAYPVFDNIDDAQTWAAEHRWPRKPVGKL